VGALPGRPRCGGDGRRLSAARGRSPSSAAFARQPVVLLPLRPRTWVEPGLAARKVQSVEHRAGGDARAAVDDELTRRELGERLVPRRVGGAGNAPRDAVDRVRLTAV